MKIQLLKYLFLFIFSILINCFYAQKEIPVGSWQDHLSYTNGVGVAIGNGVVYCASDVAVFSYDLEDSSIERLNLITGLSDIGVSTIKFNPYNNKLIIAYTNGNIDILNQDKEVTNLSFIKTSNIIGDKIINDIFLVGKYAYLSTGFGIIYIDTDQEEILDTYYFGSLGAYMYTNSVAIDNQFIYAATTQGIYFADKNSNNLADYNEWNMITDLGLQNYSTIVSYAGSLIVGAENSSWDGDTVYYNNSGTWQKLINAGVNLLDISVSSGKLLVSTIGNVRFFNTSFTQENIYYNFNNQFSLTPMSAAIQTNGEVWLADQKYGLLHFFSKWNAEKIIPNSPFNSNAFRLDIVDEDIWVVAGGYNASSLSPLFLKNHLVNYKVNDEWKSLGRRINKINGGDAFDAVRIAINPNNKSQVFVGTWNDGLFEINNGKVSNIFIAQNSTLDSTFFGSTKIGALKYDKNNNLWICSSSKQIDVISSSNKMYSHKFTDISDNGAFTSLAIDAYDNKWIALENTNNIIVFNENGSIDNTTNNSTILLTSGTNGIPGAKLTSIVSDLDGEIWIGTDQGVAVFNNPSEVFDKTIVANPIYIQQDGQTQKLLESETVTAIAIDGANRKWFGTQNSGVFLMSEDGTEEILHFTTENSPLFSNNIYDIKIKGRTGEVFIATEKGLISYKGTATESNDNFNNVFVYPNPVKPDYNGVIAIRGLTRDTDVRITDISGNLVFQTKSLGGQAIWNGNDLNGNRVQTGVYIVFNATIDGELKKAAKILFIN